MHQKPHTRQHDLDSIASIMMLRRGWITSRIEECRAIFVTTNSLLSLIAKNFLSDSLTHNSVPPLVTDETITNLVWLKKPTARPDLPTKRIIADCYAAIRPNETLLKNYHEESIKLKDDKQISFDDYIMLRYSDEARIQLMNETLGNPLAVNPQSVTKILERVKQEISSVERSKIMQLEQQISEVKEGAENISRKRIMERERVEGHIRYWASKLSIAWEIIIISALLFLSALSYIFFLRHFDGRVQLFLFLAVTIVLFVGKQNLKNTAEYERRRMESYLKYTFKKICFGKENDL